MPFDRQQQRVSMDDAIQRLAGTELASPNRFWVAFNLPEGIAPVDANDNDTGVSPAVVRGQPAQYARNLGDLGFMCSQMTFPARSFMTTEHRHVGTPFRLPYSTQYADVAFTFHCSADMRERKYFEIWQQSIVNVHINSLNFYKEYVMPVHLMQLDKEGNVTYQVTLIEAYPISIEGVTSSSAARDEVQQCTVTMAYRHWINQDLT